MIRSGTIALAALLVAVPLLGGCGSGADRVPAHTADEQKLIDQIKNETPEQQIERIKNGAMPQAAKDAMIKKIKEKNGIK